MGGGLLYTGLCVELTTFLIRQRVAKIGINMYTMIKSRFPKVSQVVQVYGVIVLIIYSWTALSFFWRLPSWLFFMQMSEILGIGAYALAFNFLESLLVLSLPLLLCVALPKAWFYDLFVVRGTVLVLCLLAYASFFSTQVQGTDDYPKGLLILSIFVCFGIAVLVYLSGKFQVMHRLFLFLSDRTAIFPYITIPLSLISLVWIIFSNLT